MHMGNKILKQPTKEGEKFRDSSEALRDGIILRFCETAHLPLP